MHTTTPSQTQSIARRALLAGLMVVVGAVAGPSSAGASSTHATTAPILHDAHHQVRAGGPRLVHGAIAEVLVRVRGGAVCSGTPITGTVYVVTAAHCVLDDHGEISSTRTVLRAGVRYEAVSVLVDKRYHDSPGTARDAAVLEMNRVIPGPSARLADSSWAQGPFTLAGFQPLDTDGSLLRGTRFDNRPHPQHVGGGVIEIETAAAGCIHRRSDLAITTTQITVPCGLIPGASGGGLFHEDDGDVVLDGIISTVSRDLTFNGVTTLAALQNLLDHPAAYRHEMPARMPAHSAAGLPRF